MHGEAGYQRMYGEARRGDATAIAAVLASVEPLTRRYLERHIAAALRRFVDPNDVWQQVALCVVERIATWPADLAAEELQAYVFQIARRRIVDAARQTHHLRGESGAPTPPGDVGAAAGTGTITRADELHQLRIAIDALPAPYANVVGRCVLEGRSVTEVASELGLTPDNVRQRLHRGRAALRQSLRKPSA